MRGERFDDLVKTLASGSTRRRFLGFFTVSAVAASFTPSDATAACLPGETPCTFDDDCCSGVCTMHGRCGCFDTGHLCPDDGYCCGGSCLNHRCR